MTDLFDWFDLPHPHVEWIGAQRLIDWYMQTNAGLSAPVTLSALFYIAGLEAARLHREDQAEKAKLAQFVGPPAPPKRMGWTGWIAVIWFGLIATAVIVELVNDAMR